MPEGRPIYPLNVAAQLVGLSPRTIRGYEEAGIIEPARVGGNRQRLYSEQDLKWLRCIRDMIHDEGLTVTAIRRLLDLIPCWQIRHCPADVALSCAPHLNIPRVACEARQPAQATDARETGEPGAQVLHDEQRYLEIRLVYGVQELGAVMPCSRCISAERIARKVALRYPGQVCVRKYPIDAPEVARFGALMPPAVLVGDEIVSSGRGISEERLEQAVARRLDQN
ncbi:MAG: MerR family transcriptional regulator [Armatimonadetes bacterium]|nr:MerR family transcriptional regulator [Armatimonadota bacterium]MDI9585523.1 MerR family transcriptional regulator [Acidobacteriota bacterium]